MNEKQRKMVLDLANEKISGEKFLLKFNLDKNSVSKYVKDNLEEIYIKKKSEYLEEYIAIGYYFVKLLNEDVIPILCKILLESWHFQHEDIAFLLELIKSPYSIPYLYSTALSRFEYLDFDENHALAVKCIWALGEINTLESKDALEKLAKNNIEVINKNAKEQLLNRKFDRVV